MKKSFVKKGLLPVLGFVMMVGMVLMPTTAKAAGTEIVTTDLFWGYPYYLATGVGDSGYYEGYSSYLRAALKQADESLDTLDTEDEKIIKMQTVFKKYESVTMGMLGGLVGADTTLDDETTRQVTELIVQELTNTSGNDGCFGGVLDTIADEVGDLKEWADRGAVIADIFKENFKDVTVGNADIDITKDLIVEVLNLNKDFINDVSGIVSDVQDIEDLATAIMLCEVIDRRIVDYMIDNVSNEDLKEGLEQYKADIDDYNAYLTRKYLTEAALNKILSLKDALINTVDSATFYSTIKKGLGIAADYIGDTCWLGDAETYLTAYKARQYADEMALALYDLKQEMCTNPVTPQMVEEYSLGYEIYLASCKVYLLAAAKVNQVYAQSLNNYYELVSEHTNYDQHILECRNRVEAIPVENRVTKAADPELSYSISKDTKVASASELLRANTIYTFDGQLLYGMTLQADAQVTFYADTKIDGTVILNAGYDECTSLTVESGASVEITGDLITDRSTIVAKIPVYTIRGSLRRNNDGRNSSLS